LMQDKIWVKKWPKRYHSSAIYVVLLQPNLF